jgi:hypothetical protein
MLGSIVFFLILVRGLHTGSTRHCGHSWPTVPATGNCEDGEVGGMNGFGRGTEIAGENLPQRHFVHKFH